MTLFHAAEPKARPLRLAISGPVGGPRTPFALGIAEQFLALHGSGRCAVIDTEFDSARLYGDRYAFDVLAMDDAGPQEVWRGVLAAQTEGFRVLVINAISSTWGGRDGVLERYAKEVDRNDLPQAFMGSNYWRLARRDFDLLLSAIAHSPLDVIFVVSRSTEKTVVGIADLGPFAEISDQLVALDDQGAARLVAMRGRTSEPLEREPCAAELAELLWSASRAVRSARNQREEARDELARQIADAATLAELEAVAGAIHAARAALAPATVDELVELYAARAIVLRSEVAP